ncbi:MAG TPA: hypothetical protein VF603_00570 [Allosphingosinicella sp.]
MQILRLRRGERAPDAADRVTINALPNGKYGFMGVTETRAEYPARSLPIYAVAPNEWLSYEEAEAAAMAWAKDHAIEILYVETGEA